MVINYKQLREKREQVKESFRRNEDLTPLVRLAQGIVDAYEISLELPSQTWTDSDGNRQIESLKRMFRCFIDTCLFGHFGHCSRK